MAYTDSLIQEPIPLGVIPLLSCSPKPSQKRRFCIEITTPNRSYWVAAETAEDMQRVH